MVCKFGGFHCFLNKDVNSAWPVSSFAFFGRDIVEVRAREADLGAVMCLRPRYKQKGRYSNSAFRGSFCVNSEHFSWSVSRELWLMTTINVSVILVCDF